MTTSMSMSSSTLDPLGGALAADAALLLRLSAAGVDTVLGAVLADDRSAARRAVRRDPVRHRAVRVVREGARGGAVTADDPRRALCRMQFLEDLVDVNALLDEVARDCLVGDTTHLTPTVRSDVALLREAAGRRLHQLSLGLAVPGMDADYRRAGEDLLRAADGLERCRLHDRGVADCADLARAVLAASHHAAGAA